MPKKAREVSGALLRKGFREVGGDHKRYVFYYNNQKTAINTKISHGETELHDGLLSAMARQMRLKRSDFDKFVECTLSEEEYTAKMLETNQLNAPLNRS